MAVTFTIQAKDTRELVRKLKKRPYHTWVAPYQRMWGGRKPQVVREHVRRYA